MLISPRPQCPCLSRLRSLAFETAIVAFAAAILVVPARLGAAQAQQVPVNLQPIDAPPTADHLPSSIDKLYADVKYESFLVEANLSDAKQPALEPWAGDLFIGKLWNALRTVPGGTGGYEVTRVTGPPGFGKSELLRYLQGILDGSVGGARPDAIRKDLQDQGFEMTEHVAWVRLENLATQFDIRSAMLEELRNEDRPFIPAFGKLPAFDYDGHAAPGVEFLVWAFNRRLKDTKLNKIVLLIDSIDEIHPQSAKSLLTRLDEYIDRRKAEAADAAGSNKGSLRVFVIGRAEGFTDYYRIPGRVPKTLPVTLKGPDLPPNSNDREVAARSVAQFVLGETSGKPGAEAVRMASVAIKFAKEHCWLDESFTNLMLLNELVKVSNDLKGPPDGVAPDEPQLKEIFFQSILDRARASHNRPAWQSQKYLELLEKIAEKYGDQCGKYFVVTPGDTVEIDIPVGRHSYNVPFLVQSALNRSGVAQIESVHLYAPRYRFYPTWVHGHLITRKAEMDKRKYRSKPAVAKPVPP
jgi:hypothetical protein